MRTSPLLALPLILATTGGARAQALDGQLDGSFGSAGQRTVSFDEGNTDKDYARAIVVDAQGRSYLVGDVDSASGRKIGIARLLANGDVDYEYGSEGLGKVVAPSGQTSINVTSAVLDAEGYLLVAGSTQVSGADTSFLVCRFDPAGELADFAGGQSPCAYPDFNIGGFKTDVANSILVQPDGKIVLAGYASTDTGTTLAVVRLLADGTPDAGFGNGGKTTYTGAPFVSFDATRIRRNPDGSFVTAGSAYDVDAAHFGVIVHVGADGVVDTEFSGGHGYARSPSSKSEFTDVVWNAHWNQYVAIGNHMNPTSRGFSQCYFASGGGVSCPHGDDSGDYNLGYSVTFSALLPQPDGRWLVAGSYVSAQNAPSELFIARLTPSLALDALEFAAPAGYAVHDFGSFGQQDFGHAVAYQGGRILVAGATLYEANTSDYDFAVAAFTLDRIFQNGMEKP